MILKIGVALLFILAQLAQKTAFSAAEPPMLFEEDPSLLTTSIQVIVRRGSAMDPEDKAGLSNFLSRLMLRGTKNRSREAFQSTLERLGGALWVSTNHDTVVFSGKVIRENTAAFLKLVSECLVEPALNKQEFELLKREITSEISYSKNRNAQLVGWAFRRSFFESSPLERPVNGTLSTVKKIKHKDIQPSYRSHFHKNNLVFAVASPFKDTDIRKQILEMWNAFPDGRHVAPTVVHPKLSDRPLLIVVHKPATSTGSIVMGQPGIVANDPNRYALMLANFAFGSEAFSSRLFKVIRSDLGWTYAIHSTYHSLGSLSHQPSPFVIASTPSVEFTVKTLFKTWAMWKDFIENGSKQAEIGLGKESLIHSYPFEFDSAEKRLSYKIRHLLYEVPILSPDEYAKTLESITVDQIKKAVQKQHHPNRWVMAVLADKTVIEKQLDQEQKDLPDDKRLKIHKVLSPEEVIQ
ncbi:MAG: insulinase family protein [Deltaproteobacteria bacterium]|nr:insulinase family protein [Deltaproteobacteria bacterium]